MSAAIRQHFNHAAPTYAQHALWQYQQAQKLWEYSATQRYQGITLDIGSGTGWIAEQLYQAGTPVIALDNAKQMLAQQQMPTLCADMHAIPLAKHSIEQAFCGMTLQWSHDKLAALAEWRRVVAPQGTLFCSVLCKGTFATLHQAIATAGFCYPGNLFCTPEALLTTTQEAGWHVAHYEMFTDTLYFNSLNKLIMHLRLTGCVGHNQANHRGLITPNQWQQLTQAYEQQRTPQGLPLEFTGLRMRLI